ncbi:MAG: HAD-IA family hydrolase [Elusimicrobiota bacterium]
MIRAIIFDMDNTLMDFMKMKRMAVESAADAMIDAGLGVPKDKLIAHIYRIYEREGIEDQQIFNKVLTEISGKIEYKILAAGIVGYRRAKEGVMSLYPHVHLTLTTLTKIGLKMAVVSDAPRLPVWMRICSLELQHYFDAVVTFDDSGERKPSAKPFQMALDQLGVAPTKALMIGDWAERDILGAKQLGMRAVWAKYGNLFETAVSGADYEIDDVIELIDIIKRENEGQLGLFKK